MVWYHAGSQPAGSKVLLGQKVSVHYKITQLNVCDKAKHIELCYKCNFKVVKCTLCTVADPGSRRPGSPPPHKTSQKQVR